MRTCRTCGELKSVEEFDVRADSGKRRTECRACRRKRQRKPIDHANEQASALDAPMKRCTRCGEVKPVAEFPRSSRSRDKRQSWCRACFSIVNGAYYASNRDREKARLTMQTNLRRAETRRRMIVYLLAHPCVDCGEADIVVLEFDHRGEKVGDVSTLANGRNWTSVLTEIEKCEVRCANCHRRATAERTLLTSGASRPKRHRVVIQLALDLASLSRECRVCGDEKPLSEFPVRSALTGVRHHICLPCQRDASARWYANAIGRSVRPQRQRGTASRAALAARVFSYLIGHACVDCGEADPIILDFDHRADKIADIATLVRQGASWDSIASEIAKCDVRCANCHRRKTVRTTKGYRLEA